MADIGRPEYPDSQYEKWLDAMSPFLKAGNTLYYAMEQCFLLSFKDSIYRKYRLKDWFCEKVDALRRNPGELVNNIFFNVINTINEKAQRKEQLTTEDIKVLTEFASKHRSAQTFFVNRTETAPAKPIEDIVDELEKMDNNSNDDIAESIKKEDGVNEPTPPTAQEQVVAAEPPVQDQGQVGEPSSVPPQPDPTPTPA